jgi:hypothetical protein
MLRSEGVTGHRSTIEANAMLLTGVGFSSDREFEGVASFELVDIAEEATMVNVMSVAGLAL